MITSENLKDIEAKLLPADFIRIHKTYLVPLSKIKYIEGNQTRVDDKTLPIGLTYKSRLMELFNK